MLIFVSHDQGFINKAFHREKDDDDETLGDDIDEEKAEIFTVKVGGTGFWC